MNGGEVIAPHFFLNCGYLRDIIFYILQIRIKLLNRECIFILAKLHSPLCIPYREVKDLHGSKWSYAFFDA